MLFAAAKCNFAPQSGQNTNPENRLVLPVAVGRRRFFRSSCTPSNRPPLSKEELLERRRRRRKKQRIQQGIVGGGALAVIVIIVISIIFLVKGCSADNKLIGKWDIDGITGYQFNKDGTGAMTLPHISYEFTYKIEDKNIIFDFKEEKVKDGTFAFEVDGDKLTLVGGENTIGGTYELTRVKE